MNRPTQEAFQQVAAFLRDRPDLLARLERPPSDRTVVAIMLAEVVDVTEITSNRWLYEIEERTIASSGKTSASYSSARSGYGINTSEFKNTASELRGHIPTAELPGTFDIYELSGTFLWFAFRMTDGALLWVTQEPNVIHGLCEEPP